MPGRVCVPVNPALVDEFDPETVPTVGDLLNELDHLPTDTDDIAKARKVEGEHRC
jgi:DNA primase small subunit